MEQDKKETPPFEEFTNQLNNKCISLQDQDKEIVSDDTAYEAYAIIKHMMIKDAGDALLYCASINLLNTYVKQRNSKIGYGFKNDIYYMTSVLLNINIDDVFIDYQDNESLLVVQIDAIQFSFHYVKKNQEIIDLCKSAHHKSLPWDGVRKQKCAVTLFYAVRENKLRVCDITYRGKSLSSKISRMMAVYQAGKSSFHDLFNS